MTRIPKERRRPYDTTEPDQLGNLLSQLFSMRGYGRTQAKQQLSDIWKKVAGEEVAGQTRVSGIKNGVLQVGVANAALMSELATFTKMELIEKFQTEFAHLKVRDIKFKLRGDLSR